MSDPSASPSQPSSGDVSFASGEPVPMGVSGASATGGLTSPSTTTPMSGAGDDRPSVDGSPPDAATEAPAAPSRTVDMVLGGIRLGVGAALVAAPRWAGRVWVGPGADGPGSLVFARAVGARDVALGLQILRGAQKGEPVRHWVTAGFVADGADVAATLIAARHLTPERRIAMPLVAAAVGAAGFWANRRA